MMKSILSSLSCLLLAAILAGCGGGASSGTSSGGGGGASTPTVVTYTFNGAPPAAVATQTGSGAFTQATLSSGKLTVTIPAGETKFSVVYLCPAFQTQDIAPTQNLEFINQATTLDGTSYSASCLAPNTSKTGTATVQVNASAIPNAAYVVAGGGALPWSAGTLDFSFSADVGVQDIPILVYDDDVFLDHCIAAKILRSQTIPGALNGGSTVVLAASDEVLPQAISYNNLPGGYTVGSPLVLYETAGRASITLDLLGPANQYRAMPPAAYQSGDYYLFQVEAGSRAPDPNIDGGTTVGVEKFTSSGGPQTFTFPAPWSFVAPTPSALPAFNVAYSGFSGTSSVSNYASIVWSPSNTSFNEITMSSTANYQNGSSSMSLPDLTALTGFLSQKNYSGVVYWTTEVLQDVPPSTNPPSGNFQFVSSNGSYTLP